MGGNGVLERGRFSQKFKLFLPIRHNINETFAVGYDTAKAQEQDLVRRVQQLRLLSRIRDIRIFQSMILLAQTLEN